MMRVTLVLLGAAAALAACTPKQVALTPEGEKVQVVETMDAVKDCHIVGTVSAAPTSAVSNEDTRLIHAKNRAAAKGGNRIVPGKIDISGTQEFSVFRCE